jgi:hypothetical protein
MPSAAMVDDWLIAAALVIAIYAVGFAVVVVINRIRCRFAVLSRDLSFTGAMERETYNENDLSSRVSDRGQPGPGSVPDRGRVRHRPLT